MRDLKNNRDTLNEYDDKIKDKCAVFGVSIDNKSDYRNNIAAELAYNALLTMQHRGQESAGIAVVRNKTIMCKKNSGLVTKVFAPNSLNDMQSCIAIGHCQYSAIELAAEDAIQYDIQNEIQPSVTEYLTGRIATVLNGSITNVRELREELMTYGLTFAGTSDGEVISKLVAYHCMLMEQNAEGFEAESVLEGVKYAAKLLEGSFSLLVMNTGKESNKLLAVRDSNGFRPLCIGVNGHGTAIASESCALDICGYDFVRDVNPGEVVQIENGKITYAETVLPLGTKNTGLCALEYVYLARPDSFMDNLSVYEARVNMGRILAREVQIEADAVCGVPASGLEAALGYSLESGIPLVDGLVCNRYIGRSFIYPTQSARENAVKLKLNPLKLNVEGKSIILVDDSIVRGTSTGQIVRELKKAGTREIHMLVSSPPMKFSCKFGCIETEDEKKLVANSMTIDEFREKTGADSLHYISIDGLKEACQKCSIHQCIQCFEAP